MSNQYQPKPGQVCKFKLVKNPAKKEGSNPKLPDFVNPMRDKPNANGKITPAHFTINGKWCEGFAYITDGVMNVTVQETKKMGNNNNKSFGRNAESNNFDNLDDFLS